jgi:hypothetical protein
MKFQVLADDADSCNQLAENLRTALKKLRMEFPVMMDVSPGRAASLNTESPVLAEDGQVIASGRILSADEIIALLRSLHSEEIEKLQLAAEREKQKAHLFKGFFLTLTIMCAVFAVGNEIRQRRQEAAAAAAKPVVLRFSRPIRMLYFYRKPRPKSDVDREVRLRRIVYAVFPAEIEHKMFSISSLDAALPENAGAVRKYGIKSFPAVILDNGSRFLPLEDNDGEQTGLVKTADLLK